MQKLIIAEHPYFAHDGLTRILSVIGSSCVVPNVAKNIGLRKRMRLMDSKGVMQGDMGCIGDMLHNRSDSYSLCIRRYKENHEYHI